MLSVGIEKTPFYQIGMKKGVEETTLKNAVVMLEKFKLSIDDVVKELNIKKSELLEYMKNKKEV